MAAVTAIVVSFASLYIAWRQTAVAEKQLEASVWPSLAYDNQNSSDDKRGVRFIVRNSGVGPARLRSIEVSHQGKPIADAPQLVSRFVPNDYSGVLPPMDITFMRGRIIPAGQELTFLEVTPKKADDPVYARLEAERFTIDGRLCFCSALDRCWTVGFHEQEPSPVKDCTEAAGRLQYGK
jgi:hypothetical protein